MNKTIMREGKAGFLLMFRLSESEFKELQSRIGRGAQAPVVKANAANELLALSIRNATKRRRGNARTLNASALEVQTEWAGEEDFGEGWPKEKDVEIVVLCGPKLLSLNVMLRRDYRSMVGYKAACYEWAKIIAHELMQRGLWRESHYGKRCDLVIYRRATKMVDADAISAMFKFLIDGLRKQGIFPDDNPKFVRNIKWVQRTGKPAIGVGLIEIGE